MGHYHHTPLCTSENVATPDVLFLDAILICILIIIQIVLLTRFLYIARLPRDQRSELIVRTTAKRTCCLYIVLQLFALFWTIADFIRGVIDPLKPFLRHNVGCPLLAYATKAIPALFYGVYLYIILLRLESLKGTHLQSSKATIYILRVLICSMIPFQAAYIFVDGDSVCLYRFETSDVDRDLFYCELTHDTTARICLFWFGVLMVVSLNLTVGVLFVRKLNQSSVFCQDALRQIAVQNIILTATGITSTLTLWMLWFIFPGSGIWLYLDLVINCCVIELWFPHNKRWYVLLCGCCIRRAKQRQNKKRNQVNANNASSFNHDDPSTHREHDGMTSLERIRMNSNLGLSGYMAALQINECSQRPQMEMREMWYGELTGEGVSDNNNVIAQYKSKISELMNKLFQEMCRMKRDPLHKDKREELLKDIDKEHEAKTKELNRIFRIGKISREALIKIHCELSIAKSLQKAKIEQNQAKVARLINDCSLLSYGSSRGERQTNKASRDRESLMRISALELVPLSETEIQI